MSTVRWGDVRRAFERGPIDGMLCTVVEVLPARENTPRRPQVCLITDFSNGSDVIVARSPAARIRELKGKRVAAEAGSLGMFVLARALEKSGMSLEDVAPLVCNGPSVGIRSDDGPAGETQRR